MSTFSWVLAAVGGFLVLYAVIALSGKGGGEGKRRKESLGCGFVLVAGAIWGIALGNYLGDRSSGLRLGLALALVLPALATLLSPGRGRLVASIVMLTLAVLLGASAVPVLWQKVHPPAAAARLDGLDDAITALGKRADGGEAYIAELGRDRERLAAQVRAFGHADFASLEQDEAALAVLRELAEVDALLSSTRAAVESARQDLSNLTAARRRVERLARGEQVAGITTDQAELERIVQEARTPLPASPHTTVEDYVAREDLRRLFEEGID